MNPFSFLDNFIKEKPFMPKVYGASDMMSGKKNPGTFAEAIGAPNPNIDYSFRNEMNSGTYTPLIPNQNYGQGPAKNPFSPYINNYDLGLYLRGTQIPRDTDPNVVPMPYSWLRGPYQGNPGLI